MSTWRLFVKGIILNFKKYWFLLSELVKKDIKLKYRRSYLGYFWTLLEPLLTMLVLATVFSQLYGKKDNLFPVYVLSGRLLYSFFNNATKSAMKSIRTNGSMIKKVYVPKYIYPFSGIVSNYIIFLLSLIDLVGVALVLGVKINWHILEAVIPLIIIFIMATGVGMILASMAVFFRDLEYLWGVILMMVMYCSAIFYEPARVVKKGFGWILDANPLYALIANFRNAIYGRPMDSYYFWYALIFSIVSLIIGLLLFRKKQDDFILNI